MVRGDPEDYPNPEYLLANWVLKDPETWVYGKF